MINDLINQDEEEKSENKPRRKPTDSAPVSPERIFDDLSPWVDPIYEPQPIIKQNSFEPNFIPVYYNE